MSRDLIQLSTIQKYCEDKTIAIVGNSDRLLTRDYGSIIDSYDIVVRMNYAPSNYKSYSKFVGSKFNIYVACMSKLNVIKEISDKQNPDYTLILSGDKVSGQVVSIGLRNTYVSDIEEYRNIKQKFKSFKPSTGSLAVNFFANNIKYKKMGLFGFDFFTSSSNSKRNIFKSFLYKDHSSEFERKFISSKINHNFMIFY